MVADTQAPPAHAHDVLVSTGGVIEHVLTQGPEAVLRLVDRVRQAGLKAKPEVGIRFGAGGATTPAELECLRRGLWGTKSLWGRVLTYDRP